MRRKRRLLADGGASSSGDPSAEQSAEPILPGAAEFCDARPRPPPPCPRRRSLCEQRPGPQTPKTEPSQAGGRLAEPALPLSPRARQRELRPALSGSALVITRAIEWTQASRETKEAAAAPAPRRSRRRAARRLSQAIVGWSPKTWAQNPKP